MLTSEQHDNEGFRSLRLIEMAETAEWTTAYSMRAIAHFEAAKVRRRQEMAAVSKELFTSELERMIRAPRPGEVIRPKEVS